MEKNHFWQGEWIDDGELINRIENLDSFIKEAIALEFPFNSFIEACDKMHSELISNRNLYDYYYSIVKKSGKVNETEIPDMLDAIVNFSAKDNLLLKLKRELGSEMPYEIRRINFKENVFEGWLPAGFLVHIAPSNVFTVSILGLLEGLLTCNINFLKTSGTESLLPQYFFEKLINYDSSGLLKKFIIIARISSKYKELLAKVLSLANVVSAWGSEEAIVSISEITPHTAKLVKWGHKISFAYVAKENLKNEQELHNLAKDVCIIEQQACSSPQNIFIETNDFNELVDFSEQFSKILDKVSKGIPKIEPEFAFQAEITNVISVAKAEQALGLTKVIEDQYNSWRIIVDKRKGLRVSPLYRSIWIKPLLPDEIIQTLIPMSSYLQTVGLSCSIDRLADLSSRFFKCGVLRINQVGKMLSNYIGEPHDGRFALTEFVKRVSVNFDDLLRRYSGFFEFLVPEKMDISNYPVLTKAEFQSRTVDKKFVDLVFKSGGSSGKPTFSTFTYDDYHTQMLASAYGLFAAGLDPKNDRVLNLLAAGELYGGFLSFFTIMEFLEVPQYPMGIIQDTKKIAELIVSENINTLISVPSYIIKVFKENEELLSKHRFVKKIFYGGEHITKSQVQYLQEVFGVDLIRSAIYGSNDAGPLGYQCQYCVGSEHHLLSLIQELEIFKFDKDEPADFGEVGRLIFTSKKRKGQQIIRYEIGDTGRFLSKKCKCGRTDPLFELTGRTGDVFKAGGPFLNYQYFVNLLEKHFSYSGNAQIILQSKGVTIEIILLIDENFNIDEELIKKTLIDNYDVLNFSIYELNVNFVVKKISEKDFVFIPHSGKLKHIIDNRL